MIIKPKVRGFICITACPERCRQNVLEQIFYVKAQNEIAHSSRKVLVVGSSPRYGIANRIVASFGPRADTIGTYFERAKLSRRPACAGFDNACALNDLSKAEGISQRALMTIHFPMRWGGRRSCEFAKNLAKSIFWSRVLRRRAGRISFRARSIRLF
jgi:trans-2-enoyl-CoA reductase